MTVDLLAGASSNKVSDWEAVYWPKVRCYVRRLQLRIAKAIRAGKHGKAKALSWLLYIPKKNGKLRPLSIPTLHDRAQQALHALALKPIAETVGDRNSYGFREGRSCADAIGQCFCALAKSYAPVWVLEGAIKSCFDRISHPWLLKPIPMDKRMLRQWLKAGYWENGQLFPTNPGDPARWDCLTDA